jgi:hypothetical protein
LQFDLKLNAGGRAYIAACLKHGPSRKAQNRRGNCLVKFTSMVIGVQVMLESRHGEFPLAVLRDADKQAICFLAQAPELRLAIKDEQGVVRTTTPYTPDLLVLQHGGIVRMSSASSSSSASGISVRGLLPSS